MSTDEQEFSTVNLINSEKTLQSIIIVDNNCNTVDYNPTDLVDEEVLELIYQTSQVNNEIPSTDDANFILQSTTTDLNEHILVDETISFNNEDSTLSLHHDNGTQLTIVNQNHQTGK